MASTSNERRYETSENVVSTILRQALYIIKTVPDFQNLTCRLIQTHTGSETIVVYREGINGVLGPPLDPLTLTLEPSGSCLLNILFRPVQRVTIVPKGSGCIEIASLMAILELVAGKGYVFCPGLPEKFLIGKACGKMITMHRIPFRRFQSNKCLVYYKLPPSQKLTKDPKSLCALCPHCLVAAKIVQSLPILPFPRNPAVATNVPRTQPYPNAVEKYEVLQTNNKVKSSSDCTIMSVENKFTPSPSATSLGSSKLSSTPVLVSQLTSSQLQTAQHLYVKNLNKEELLLAASKKLSKFETVSVVQQVPIMSTGAPTVGVRSNSAPVIGTDDTSKVTENKTSLGKSLKQILQDKILEQQSSSIWEDSSLSKIIKGKGCHKNICTKCKKQFSSAANLQNHYQRHEGLSGTKHRRKGKTSISSTSGRLKVKLLQQSRRAPNNPRKISGTSLRLFKKYLDDMLPSRSTRNNKETKDSKSSGKEKVKQRRKVKSEAPLEDRGLAVTSKRGVKRSLSGSTSPSSRISPMQTLLEVALKHSDGVSTDSSEKGNKLLPPGQKSISSVESGVGGPDKKVRKSSRLASKAKDRGLELNNLGQHLETASAPVTPQDSFTNLNLLSTVSLEKAMQENPLNPQIQSAVPSAAPIAILSPLINSSTAFPRFSGQASLPKTTAFNSVPSRFPLSTSASGSAPSFSIRFVQGAPHPTNKQATVIAHGVPNQGKGQHPPMPPLVLASSGQQGQAIVSNLPHKTILDSSLLPSSKDLRKANTVMVSPAVAKAHEVETSSDCGAIDLSKPKVAFSHPNIPSSVHAVVPSTSMPESVAQYLTLLGQGSQLAPAVTKPQPPQDVVHGDKLADSCLQARIFASARDYRLDSGKGKLQAVIASTTRLSHSNKDPSKANTGQVRPEDEIQCGYKWSGSGGLVKERTQMVRELVPSNVIANYLTGRGGSNHREPHMRPVAPSFMQGRVMPSPQSVEAVGPEHPVPSALNLSTTKAPPNSSVQTTTTTNSTPSPYKRPGRGRPRRSQVNSVPSPITTVTISFPTNTPPTGVPSSLVNSSNYNSGILRASLMSPQSKADTNSGLVSQLFTAPAAVNSTEKRDEPKSVDHSPQISTLGTQQKIKPHVQASLKAHLFQKPLSPVSSGPSTSTTSPATSISSPSLAAILRQPVDNTSTAVVTTAKSSSNNNSEPDVIIKKEPEEPYDRAKNEPRIIMSLPMPVLKKEVLDCESGNSRDSSPSNLVVDMSHRDSPPPGSANSNAARVVISEHTAKVAQV